MQELLFTVGKKVFTISLEAQDYAKKINKTVTVSGGCAKKPEKNTKQPNQIYTKSEKELIVKTIKDYFSGLTVPSVFKEIIKLVTYEELWRSVGAYQRTIKKGSNRVDIDPDEKMLLDNFIDEHADKIIEITFPDNQQVLKIRVNFAPYFCNQIIRNSF